MTVTSRELTAADALVCREKVPFAWHYLAEDAAERHIACSKCLTTRQGMEAYRCPVDPAHFHVAHKRAAP